MTRTLADQLALALAGGSDTAGSLAFRVAADGPTSSGRSTPTNGSVGPATGAAPGGT